MSHRVFLKLPLFVCICFCFMSKLSIAQISEINRTNHWYFGEGIGINFSGGLPVIDTLSPMSQREACAVMSDTSGNLLFYTDGDTIWNKNHQVMLNGFDIGCESSSNGAVIVPQPGNDTIYYLFTVDCWENFGANGLRYSIIDINGNGGAGTILQKNIPLFAPTSEQLAVTRHCNGLDYWVVAHAYSVNQFYAYKVTSNGVDNNAIVSNIGDTLPVSTPIGNAGSMGISPNGKKLCFVNIRKGVRLFDFDLLTGALSNMIVLTTDSQYFGCAFSPDNSKLYTTFLGVPQTGKHIAQYDLTSNDSLTIINSKYLVIDTTYFVRDWLNLQLARDGIIYSTNYNINYLCAIQYPNVYGPGCGFVYYGLDSLPRKCQEQFPNINTNYYNPDPYGCINSIDEISAQDIEYYPNPVSDYLIVTNLNRWYESIIITDCFGRQIYYRRIAYLDEVTIDFQFFATGVYAVHLVGLNNAYNRTVNIIND